MSNNNNQYGQSTGAKALATEVLFGTTPIANLHVNALEFKQNVEDLRSQMIDVLSGIYPQLADVAIDFAWNESGVSIPGSNYRVHNVVNGTKVVCYFDTANNGRNKTSRYIFKQGGGNNRDSRRFDPMDFRNENRQGGGFKATAEFVRDIDALLHDDSIDNNNNLIIRKYQTSERDPNYSKIAVIDLDLNAVLTLLLGDTTGTSEGSARQVVVPVQSSSNSGYPIELIFVQRKVQRNKGGNTNQRRNFAKYDTSLRNGGGNNRQQGGRNFK